jgi:2-amino-4-hydroxy-6-hydroxymethyldihydropteridine diphosphokinase
MSIALIGLGANLNDPASALREAISRISCFTGDVSIGPVSSFVETAAVGGPPGQPPFTNAVMLAETSLTPRALAGELWACEAAMGRQPSPRWGPRPIDLDLLLFDDRVVDLPELTVPHPRMAFRRFVLAPACEIAATILHPTSRWPLSRLLAHLDSGPDYVAIAGGDAQQRAAIVRTVSERIAARPIYFPPPAAGSDAEPGPGQLEWIDQAGQLLSRGKAQDPTAAVISDFWFDEPMLACEADAPDAGEVVGHWKARRAQVMQPKLVVWLDDEPPAYSTGDAAEKGEAMAQWLDRQPPRRAAFYRHVLAHDVGATLRLDPLSPGAPVDEIVAALAAIKPLDERIR